MLTSSPKQSGQFLGSRTPSNATMSWPAAVRTRVEESLNANNTADLAYCAASGDAESIKRALFLRRYPAIVRTWLSSCGKADKMYARYAT